jgi:hypothetical protein
MGRRKDGVGGGDARDCGLRDDPPRGRVTAVGDSDRVILDPTAERRTLRRRLSPRGSSLRGPIGLVDIAKARGDVFLDELEALLRLRAPSEQIIRLRKPTFTKPAPRSLRDEIAQRCRVVIQALAD